MDGHEVINLRSIYHILGLGSVFVYVVFTWLLGAPVIRFIAVLHTNENTINEVVRTDSQT